MSKSKLQITINGKPQLTKSKQFLADAIHASGKGWPDGADFAAQDKDMWICLYDGKPTRRGNAWKEKGDCLYKLGFSSNKLSHNWHQTCLSIEEYFSAYPAEPLADADGWIEWKGGECPVDGDSLVTCKVRTGKEFLNGKKIKAAALRWRHKGGMADIIAYRLHKPEQAKAEFCESVMRSIPEPEINSKNINITQVDDINVVESKPTIEQLAADYRNAKDYADRKQQEADDAKADADERLKALELAGEAIGLLVSPINAKKEPEMVISVQVGDEVECIKSNVNPNKYRGMIGTVSEVDDSSTPYLVDFGGKAKIWCHEVKFIRRP